MGNIVLVGAGGTGMSGVAGILADIGYGDKLICIDGFQSQLTDNLIKKGLKVIIGHDKYEPKIDDVFIYSEAVPNCPEIVKARELIKTHKKMVFIMNYFQFLGEISKYFTTIGITGTNGKSSTTALAIYGARNFSNFGLGILGALVPDFDNQSYLINQDHKEEIKTIFDHIFTGKFSPLTKLDSENNLKSLLFVVEACEYKRHFLNLDLDYSAITNIEYDHADYYKSFDDYKQAFKQMLSKTKKKCFVLEGFLKDFPKFELYQDKIEEIQEESHTFKYIFGPHTNKNFSLTKILLSKLIDSHKLPDISDFKGLRRRLEYLGNIPNGATVFSDYGHMASSIALGYKSLKQKFPQKKLVAIFQPHQITRIFTGRDDFVESFKGYDKIFIYDIYAARENLEDFDFSQRGKNIKNINELGDIFAKQCGGIYIQDWNSIKKEIEKSDGNDCIVIYSAGDIDYKIRNDLILSQKTISNT